MQRALIVGVVLIVGTLAGCTDGDVPPGGGNGNGPPPDDGPMIAAASPDVLMALVDAQVYHGTDRTPWYRIPGTPEHDALIPVLETMLEERDLDVEKETFMAELPVLGEVQLTNLYGVRRGTSPNEVWLAAHWDSRAWADMDPDPANRDEPVLGANDGAAAVAVVVHVLDLLPSSDLSVRVALFDGEDQGMADGWAVGSRYAADALSEDELDRIVAFILVDMPGDKDLQIRREGQSNQRSGALTDLVFGVAERLGATSFINVTSASITDDHTAFLARGVNAVDLIHLDDDPCRSVFPCTHHTVSDTPENLSGEKMAEVAAVVAHSVWRIDRNEG